MYAIYINSTLMLDILVCSVPIKESYQVVRLTLLLVSITFKESLFAINHTEAFSSSSSNDYL